MVRFNSDVVFVDGSGQVRAIHGDLSLRANEDGGGHIIVGSGVSLRPDIDCHGSPLTDGIDLGQEDFRWRTLYACSGNFISRPHVNGSGVLLQGEASEGPGGGVDSVNTLTGDVVLTSPGDSVTINVNGQDIELTTPSGYAPSGASYLLADYNDNDHLVDARKLTATSGIILDDQGARSVSGIAIKLDFDVEPAADQLLSWNGSKLEWTDPGAAAGVDSVNTLTGAVVLTSPDASVTFV